MATNRVARWARFGQGTVVGGRVGLALAPDLLRTLSRDRRIALVSGTNGKTTTTRLLAAALGAPGSPGLSSVAPVSNVTGANMPEGHVAALSERWSPTAVLEVDESYLGQLVSSSDPAVVVLLNLSRDQLDRIAEVRLVAERWRTVLDRRDAGGGRGTTVVVANADDPLVVWAAEVAPVVIWVGVGQVWDEDSVGCPRCGGSLLRGGGGWHCARCSFARPTLSIWTEGRILAQGGGVRTTVDLALPGEFNVANAAMAAVGAAVLSQPGAVTDQAVMAAGCRTALAAMREVGEIGGRFGTLDWRGVAVRRLLAKNPAGWAALFDLLDEADGRAGSVVLAINARTADGLDTSWLWDVPFERLQDRRVVVATGERARDLAVRLQYAGVDHVTAPDVRAALDYAAGRTRESGALRVDFIGNYTAFARFPAAP